MNTLIIAEVGMNHDGSLGNAIRMAEAAASGGADAVKFQLHDAAAETVRNAPAPPYFKGESRWDYFNRTAFDDGQWRELKAACDAVGVEFLCSAFSLQALHRLEGIGVARHKIASGEVTNLDLIRAAADTGKPVLVSSGMSSLDELDAAIEAAGPKASVMQCTSAYPTPPERVGLNVIGELSERYGLPVGFSDHSEGPYAIFAAVTLGAAIVEKHFTLSKLMYGPDAALAMEPDEFRHVVEGVRQIERMLAAPIDKTDLSEFDEMKRVFEKSVVAVAAIEAGAVITGEMVAAKKPGTGIPARRLAEVVGRRALTRIEPDQVLTDTDVEWDNTRA